MQSPKAPVSRLRISFTWQCSNAIPLPKKIAKAKADSLAKIPYLTAKEASAIQKAARLSVGSFGGPTSQEPIKSLVRQIQQDIKNKISIEKLLSEGYRALSSPNLLDTAKHSNNAGMCQRGDDLVRRFAVIDDDFVLEHLVEDVFGHGSRQGGQAVQAGKVGVTDGNLWQAASARKSLGSAAGTLRSTGSVSPPCGRMRSGIKGPLLIES